MSRFYGTAPWLRHGTLSVWLLDLLRLAVSARSECRHPPQGMINRRTGDGTTTDLMESNHGTPGDGATFDPGLASSAIDLDGVDDDVRVPDGPWIRRRGTLVTCAIALLSATAATADPPSVEAQRLEQAIRESEYRLSWQEAPQLKNVEFSWQAPNRAQGIRSLFTDEGLRVFPRLQTSAVEWEVGLTLIGFGRDARVVGVEPAALAADDKRIAYDRGRVVEWYVNEPRGLEQGFDLDSPPETAGKPERFVPGARRSKADGEAYLVLSIEGSLSPRIDADGRSVDFAETSGGVSLLHYGKLEVRDAKGQVLDSWIEGFAEAGIRGLRIVFVDADAVYPVTVDPLLTTAAWEGESDQAGASFGISVAGGGDLNHDGFDDVIVGASAYDVGPNADAGRVFVYYGSAAGLSAEPDWSAEADSVDAGFGYAVRTGGDLDGDGKDDLIVGAPFLDNAAGAKAGAVFVYYGPLQHKPCGETGTGEAVCHPSEADWAIESDAPDVHLGAAVDVAGDVNGDGRDDLIVGSNYGNKVFVIYGSLQDKTCGDVPGGEIPCLPAVADWIATESSQPGTYRSRFGSAVAGAGNVNGDAYDDVIIGAFAHDSGMTDEGRAYVFLGPLQDMTCGDVNGAEADCVPDVDSDWMADGNQSYAYFGAAVASAGDVNGDGFDEIIVGANGYDNNQSVPAEWDYGQARVYHGSVLGPSSGADWVAMPEAGSTSFGFSVAGAGDVNRDGYDDVIVGARYYDGGGTNEGRAYVYEGSPTGLAPANAWSWAAEGNQFSAQLGCSVAAAGDVNGDGFDDVIVGAPGYSHGQESEGRAAVYHGAPKVTGWTLASHLGLQPLQIRSATWSIRPGATADPVPVNATPAAVSYGPVPESILLTTGRVTDRDLALDFPATSTGIEDVDWGEDGQGDVVTFTLDLNVPSWAKTIRFTTQFLTNEIGERSGGDPYDSDSASFEFNFNGWSRDWYPLNDPARWVVNPPQSHCINVVGGTRVVLVFKVEDVDGSQDTGLLLSRVFFSTLPFPSDITLEHDGVDGNGDGVVDYFANPAPHDVSLSSGTYSFTRDLFAIPGLSMPFRFAIVYNSRADRAGSLGRKWTHSYDGYTEKIMTDEDGNGSAETLSAILVRHGAGTAEYFEPNEAGGYRPKYSGSYSKLTESSGTYRLVNRNHLTYEFAEPGDTDDTRLLTRVTDPNGVSFALTYTGVLGSKKISSMSDTRGEQIDFLYSNGRLTSVEYAWETSDEPPRSVVSSIQFAYDLSTGDLVSIVDLDGYATTFDYDRVGNLLGVTDAEGLTSVANTFEQYQGINLLQVGDRVVTQRNSSDPDPYDPAGGVSYEYDGESLLQTDRLGNEDRQLFDVRGRMARRIDPSGVLWEYIFDRNGNNIETRRKLPSEERPRVMSVATYDERGNLVESVDFPRTCIGGPNIELTCSADAECPRSSCGVRESRTYDIYGNLRSTTDHLGNTTAFGYDSNHNPISKTDPLGNTVFKSYTVLGQPELKTNARGYTYRATYGAPLQAPTRIETPVDADGDGSLDSVEYLYDGLGRKVSTTDPNGNTTSFVYDDLGRLLSQTDALGNTTRRTYDSAGRPLSTQEADGAVTSFLYTSTGKLTQETDALGNSTRYGYDEEDRLVSVVDPMGRSVHYDYDPSGRLTFVESCDAGKTDCTSASVEFDEVGNLSRLIDPRGNSTWFEYDLMGRVTRETNELAQSTSYGYDGRGLLTSFTNARGQTLTFHYDAAGRQTGIDLGGSTVVHTYDGNGNPVASVSDRFASATRAYDGLDRIVERTDEYDKTVRYAYDPAGNLRELTYSDGSRVVYSYDALNRLIRLEDWYDPAAPPPAPLSIGECEASPSCRVTSYGYDAVGNPVEISLPDGSTVTQAYDPARRLLRISDAHPVSGTIFAATHSVNPSGLLVASGLTLPLDPQVDAGSETLQYNELNQIVSRGTDLFVYDADGNLTDGVIAGASVSLTYDEMNQLVQVGADTYGYDVDGLRVETTRAGETRRFVYDSTAGLPRLLEEHDAEGNLVARYVHGLGLVSRASGGGADYRVYHYDARGSTVALTDATGAITDAYAYGPYGAPAGYEDRTPGDPATHNPFRYNGRDGVIDDGNGLYYMRARYYAPELMRFVQQDVAPTGLTDAQSVNRYAYVRGNPVQFVDSDGNWFGIDDLIAIVAGAVVGAISQGVECAISGGDACGWEEFVSATASGAVAGGLSLYIGPVAAGAVGGALDAGLTWGLKAIRGGATPGSWQDNVWSIAEGAALGGTLGKAGGGGKGRDLGKSLYRKLRPPGTKAELIRPIGTKAELIAEVGGKVTKNTTKFATGVLEGVLTDSPSALLGVGAGWVTGQAKDYTVAAWAAWHNFNNNDNGLGGW